MTLHVRVTLNGAPESLAVADDATLLDGLRANGWTGTKKGCEVGECGSCTVILDGEPVCSCLVLAAEVEGSSLVTIEGVARAPGELDALQENFMACGAAQCGFCTPGIIVAAKALLAQNPSPTRDEIRFALAGNICRCTGYTKIIDAIEMTARQGRAGARPYEVSA
ncbi:MAG TPA: (2Fe-2S)-binding protein [Caldimonas sp.]|nr:(2Fe-2S)-binding protein [Caldimonas sp.]